MEGEGCPPILRDKMSLLDFRRGDERVEIAHVILETIRDLRAERGKLRQGYVRIHRHSSLKTVSNAIVLKRSSGAALRSTFIRRIAPSQEARRNSARSSAVKVVAISPAACASAMQAAKGDRHCAKVSTRRERSISLWGMALGQGAPVSQPRVNPSAASRAVMI